MNPRDPHRPTASGSRIRIVILTGLVLMLAAVWGWRHGMRPAPEPRAVSPSSAALPTTTVERFVALEARESEVDQGAFARDRQAREFAGAIETLWNALNASPDALGILESLPIDSLSWSEPESPAIHPPDITRWRAGTGPSQRRDDWRALLSGLRAAGWRLVQSEFRHLAFQPAAAPVPARSTFEISLHLTRSAPEERAQLRGALTLHWPDAPGLAGARGELIDWETVHRAGPPAFHPIATIAVEPFAKTSWIDPLILYDLDHDGALEILLVARNLVLKRQPDGSWQNRRLSAFHPGLLFTAVLADFTGDARDDLLLAVRSGLVLLPGGATGAFDEPARAVWLAPEKLRYAQALTCGDVDRDGDLDVFLAQYRPPYEGGQMPRPFYDANDGPPSYLLLNRGDGTLDDATATAGLAPLRHRRTYSASFVDLDHDADLDLVVVSDFAGLDVHANDGHGRFQNRTAAWIDEPRAFGMAHALADFDASGAFDLFMIGMPQPTADRLTHAGLERPGFAAWTTERARVAQGNRLYFREEGARYRERPVSRQVARAGWAWGVADADLDLDRFPDLHIVNGHETRASVRDFESEFWTHDIYAGDSTPRPEVEAYFAGKFARTRALGWSYGGYDKNRLLLNREGREFVEVGHLLGVALQEDCRNTVAADFDGDGDPDLVTTTFEIWPAVRQTVRLFENRLPHRNHWIGIRLVPQSGRPSPVGATVTLVDTVGRQQRPWITGNRFRSQDPGVIHFGLGPTARPLQLEVRWPGGRVTRLDAPDADRIHDLPAPPL